MQLEPSLGIFFTCTKVFEDELMFTSGTLSLDVATNDYLVTIIYNVIKSTFNPTILCLLVASNILKWVPKICTK
jgi:hypothetical protein